MKKKITDRRDGTKIQVGGTHKFLYHLKPKRSESEVHIFKDIDVTNLVKYINDKKKEDENLTYFHAFCTAIGRALYNYPSMNRFIVNGSYYMRNKLSIGFVAKVAFTDEAKECLTVVELSEKDTLSEISKKVSQNVKQIRSSKDSQTDSAVELVGKLPKPLRAFVIWIFKKLDDYDLLPASLLKNSIYHCSVLVTNLGSINCGAIYHNLTNFGTNSILISIGKIEKKVLVINNKEEIRDVCQFGVTLDERI